MVAHERTVLQWANEMVTRWVRVVIGDRCVIATVVFNNCRSDAVGDDAIGIVFERKQRWLNYLWIPYDDGFVCDGHGGGFLRSGKNAWCWWSKWCNFAK